MTDRAGGTVPATSDASRFAPPADGATPANCLNCGAALSSRFCPECGQRAAAPDPTLREMLEELAAELLHWDGKLWATVKALVRQPGLLTLEYVAGRRTSYISPLRLYLSASVLYFFLAAVGPRSENEKPFVRVTSADSAGSSAARQSANGIVVAAEPTTDTTPPTGLGAQVERRVEQGVARAARDPERFGDRLKDNLATVVFLVLPAFAFAVGLAYRSQRRHFPQHVVFALHVHALAFLGFTVTELARLTGRASIETGVDVVVTLAVAAYVVAALRRAYGGTIWRTVAKAAVLGVVYLCFFLTGLIGLTIYGFLTT
jgi:hypothetical protein